MIKIADETSRNRIAGICLTGSINNTCAAFNLDDYFNQKFYFDFNNHPEASISLNAPKDVSIICCCNDLQCEKAHNNFFYI